MGQHLMDPCQSFLCLQPDNNIHLRSKPNFSLFLKMHLQEGRKVKSICSYHFSFVISEAVTKPFFPQSDTTLSYLKGKCFFFAW